MMKLLIFFQLLFSGLLLLASPVAYEMGLFPMIFFMFIGLLGVVGAAGLMTRRRWSWFLSLSSYFIFMASVCTLLIQDSITGYQNKAVWSSAATLPSFIALLISMTMALELIRQRKLFRI